MDSRMNLNFDNIQILKKMIVSVLSVILEHKNACLQMPQQKLCEF